MISCLVVLLAAVEPAPAPAPVAKTTLIAVPELAPLGVSAEMAQNLTAVIAAELGRYEQLRVISNREIALLLGVERQKELLGCADDSCVAQLAGALGAEKILSGQIGTVEQSIVFTLQLTDVRSARVDGRVVKVVPAGKNQIVDAVRATVTQLMGDAKSRNQPPRLAVREAIVAQQGETVQLDASRCYDPDGDPLRTDWQQLDGPPADLEGAHEATASFRATEVGHYTFRVSVTDGRSVPVVVNVSVEVLKWRPFSIGVAFQIFAPFNRFVLTDGVGGEFRSRTPAGGDLQIGLRLTERWQLLGYGELSYMNAFSPNERVFEYVSFNLLAGLRYYVSFGVFKLFAQLTLGSSRLFFWLRDGTTALSHGTAALVGQVSGGVDVPVSERFGFALGVGIRAQGNSEGMPATPGFSYTFAPGGFIWGLHASVGPYVRL